VTPAQITLLLIGIDISLIGWVLLQVVDLGKIVAVMKHRVDELEKEAASKRAHAHAHAASGTRLRRRLKP